jgi:hypothetical protein
MGKRRAAVCGLLLLLGIAACGDDGRTSSEDTTTSADRTTSTAPVTPTGAPTTGETHASTTADAREPKCATVPATDPTAPPDDWAQYWQTKPAANQSLRLEICVDDVTLKVGAPVTLTVTADDPDASIGDGGCDIYVGWATTPAQGCRDAQAPPSSPVPTPSPVHGHVRKTFTHAYTKAQTYLLFVTVWSSPESPTPQPYASKAETSLHITVLP